MADDDVLPSILVSSSEIPKRLSAVEDHPDFHPVWSRCVAQVYFHDKPVKDVMRFDVQEGWIEFHVRDAKGQLIRVRSAAGDFLATRREYGPVHVKFRVPEGMRP